MKTAVEVLTEIHPKPVNGNLDYAWVIQSMKVYANHKLDEASEKANLIEDYWSKISEYKFYDTEHGCRISVNKESILSLKDKI